MAEKLRIRANALQAVRQALEAMPENEDKPLSKLEAVRLVLPQIEASRQRGYSLQAIAELLCERGIHITQSVLRSYLTEARSGGRKAKRRGGATRARSPRKAIADRK